MAAPCTESAATAQNKSGGQKAAAQEPFGSKPLDQIDLGRQVARNFENNFLLANCRLHPDFHGESSSIS